MVALVIIFLLMADVSLQTWLFVVFLVSVCPLQEQYVLGSFLVCGRRIGKQIGA